MSKASPAKSIPTAQKSIMNYEASSYVASVYCGTGREGVLNAEFENAEFNHPTSLLCLPDGLILVCDRSNNKLRVLNVKNQQVTDFCPNAKLLNPSGLCLWNQDTVLVCDTGHNRIKQISLRAPNKATYFAGCGKKGTKDGRLKECEFNKPTDICVASDGSIIVSDSGNNRIRRILPNLNRIHTITKGPPGYKDGDVKDAQFRKPTGLHLDFDGGILVCDSRNNSIRKISKDFSTVFTVAGGSMNKGVLIDGACTDCSFSNPTALTLASNGDIYVVDTGNNCIRKISDGVVTTFAGGSERTKDDTILSMKGNAGYRDGPVSHCIFNGPKDILCLRDEQDIIIVSDSNNNVLRILYPSEDELLASTLISEKTNTPSRSASHRAQRFSSSYGANSVALSPTQRSFSTEKRLSIDAMNETATHNSLESMSNTSVGKMNDQNVIYSAQYSPSEEKDPDDPGAYSFYELIYQHEDDLSRIFAYYSNANSAKYESSHLSAVKFMRFVKDCKLLDEQKLNSSHIFIIFYEVTKHNNMRMNFNDFANGLCLLARKKFSPQKSSLLSTSSLSFADDTQVKQLLRNLLYQYVLPNARRSSLDPSIEELSDQEVYSVWSKHEHALYKIFSHYASSSYTPHETKSWKNTQKALHTLNIEEFYKFCKDFDIFPLFMSKQKLTTIFRSSVARSHHFDYDPREEDDSSKNSEGKSPSTDPVVNLDFFCFLECLGRIAVTRYSGDDLENSYPTTSSKIEALLEHMHLSQGRERFAVSMGSRLFKGLNSPRQKELYNEMKNKPQKSDPNAYHLNYSKFSQKKKQKDGRYAGILKNATHSSRLYPVAMPLLPSDASSDDTGSYLAKHLTKRDRDIQYKSTSMERVLCTAENVILFLFDQKRKFWKYLCTGTVKIVNNPSFLIPLKRPFLIRFIERETDTELANIICTDNLPYVDHEELFHIWKKGDKSKQKHTGLFPDGRIYGIQFPNIESSKSFEEQYTKITSCELSMSGSDDKKIIRYDFMNLSRQAKSMSTTPNAKLHASSKSLQQTTKSDLSKTDLSKTDHSKTYSPNKSEKIHSPLTKSMLLSPKVAYTPTRNPSMTEDYLNSTTISNLPHIPAPSSPQSQSDTQFGSEDGQNMVISDYKTSKSISQVILSPNKKQSDAQDVLQYERTLNKLITDYFSSCNDGITSEEVSREVKRRIKWATGLQLSHANELFQEELSPTPMLEEPFSLLDSRRETVAHSLMKLDISICSNFTTLKQYHSTIRRSLPRETLLLECYLKDSLGMNMFTHMPIEAFSAVLGDVGQFTIHLIDNGDLVSSKNAARDVVRANVVFISTQTGRRTVHQDICLNFDDSKPSSFFTIPFVVSNDDFSKNDDDSILCLQDFQPVAGPIYECSFKVEVELLVREFGVTKKKFFSFPIRIGTFGDRASMDRVFVSMKESGVEKHARLPSILRPLSLFAFREITRFE